jgi:DNA-binding CsgD family transcriptional regulator
MSRSGETLDLLSRSGQPAFAIDATDRIVFWNKECEDLLGIPSRQALGKYCFDVIGGRDANGNVYCYRNCPVAHQARSAPEEPVNSFRLSVKTGNGRRRSISVSMFAIPAVRPAQATVVHLIREEADEPTALEKQLAARASRPAQPLWPIEPPEGRVEPLTSREKEILRALSEGLATAAIARKLFISPVTVRNHVQNILRKLDCHTKLSAIVFAYRHGLVD